MPQSTSIFEELVAALRGMVALLTGNRQAARHFDFSQRGLAGSFIALLAATVLTAFGPQLLGLPSEPGAATRSIFLGATLFGLQVGVAWLVLRQLGRLDGFVPYLVADNWISLFISVLTVVVLGVIGAADVVLLAVGLVAIIVEINIARLIVTLMPMQIVMFIGAQFVAQFLGLMMVAGFAPGAPLPAS